MVGEAKDGVRLEGVVGNVGSKVRKAIRKAAEQCGEDGDTWIQNFSEELRHKLQEQANKENALAGTPRTVL